MRKHIYVRPATWEDGPIFKDWVEANKEKNKFDPAVMAYPNTITLCAYDEDGPLAFLPFQQPLMVDASGDKPIAETPMFLEGLAMRPGASKLDTSRALKEFIQAAVFLGHMKGTGELYFLGTDEGTDALAENQLFERLNFPIYRLRLSDLEKQSADND